MSHDNKINCCIIRRAYSIFKAGWMVEKEMWSSKVPSKKKAPKF